MISHRAILFIQGGGMITIQSPGDDVFVHVRRDRVCQVGRISDEDACGFTLVEMIDDLIEKFGDRTECNGGAA